MLLAVLVLAACQNGDASPGPSPGSPAPSPSTGAGPVSLTVQVYGDPATTTAYRRIAAAFTREHPGVKVTLTRAPDATAAAQAVLADPEHAPDVFLLDEEFLARMVAADAVTPLDQRLEDRGLQFGDDYQRSALTALSADSELKCMPAEMSPLVVYYNRALVPRRFLRRSGFTFPRPDETWRWEDFEAAVRATAGLDRLGPIKGTYL